MAKTPTPPQKTEPKADPAPEGPIADGVIIEKDAEGWSVYVVKLQGGREVFRKRTDGPVSTRAFATDGLKVAVVSYLMLGRTP